MLFVYCLFVEAAGTADSISRERREGPLGLLFLTNLNSAEIVAGKVFSNGLALAVLIGGITLGQFWRAIPDAKAGGVNVAQGGGLQVQQSEWNWQPRV